MKKPRSQRIEKTLQRYRAEEVALKHLSSAAGFLLIARTPSGSLTYVNCDCSAHDATKIAEAMQLIKQGSIQEARELLYNKPPETFDFPCRAFPIVPVKKRFMPTNAELSQAMYDSVKADIDRVWARLLKPPTRRNGPNVRSSHLGHPCCVSCGGVVCDRCGTWWLKKEDDLLYLVCKDGVWSKMAALPYCVYSAKE